MRLSITTPRSTLSLLTALFLACTGCGNDDPPTRPPTGNVAVQPGTPVEIREDAAQVGRMDPITLDAASREGTNLNVTVMYSGCKTHTIRALVTPCVFETYPVTIDVYLQHDANGERCDMTFRQELSFDVRPILEWLESEGSMPESFSARVITPDPSGSKRVLFEL